MADYTDLIDLRGACMRSFRLPISESSNSASSRAAATFLLSLPNIGEETLRVTWLQAAAHLFYFHKRQIFDELLDKSLVDGSWALERKSWQFKEKIDGSRFARL